jgi:transcriptional/translational regulatory protein YebC/TACO1
MEVVLEAGGEDIKDDGDQWEVLSDPVAHEAVLKALEAAKIPTEESSIAMVPKNLLRLEGKNAAAMLRLNEALEEHDDVQNVYSNFDIDEKELESLSA